MPWIANPLVKDVIACHGGCANLQVVSKESPDSLNGSRRGHLWFYRIQEINYGLALKQ